MSLSAQTRTELTTFRNVLYYGFFVFLASLASGRFFGHEVVYSFSCMTGVVAAVCWFIPVPVAALWFGITSGLVMYGVFDGQPTNWPMAIPMIVSGLIPFYLFTVPWFREQLSKPKAR